MNAPTFVPQIRLEVQKADCGKLVTFSFGTCPGFSERIESNDQQSKGSRPILPRNAGFWTMHESSRMGLMLRWIVQQVRGGSASGNPRIFRQQSDVQHPTIVRQRSDVQRVSEQVAQGVQH
eukprot:2349245-Amphidinium_carterae.1